MLRRSRSRRGFTLIELGISLAVLAVALAGIFSAMWTAMVTTRQAKPRFVAKQAATRLLAELEADSVSLVPFYKNYWKGDAGNWPDKLSGAQVRNVGTLNVYIDCDLLPAPVFAAAPTAFSKNTFDEILTPALNAKILQRQGNDPMLRLRFLSEDQYNKLWGNTTPVDLNFNGTTTDGIELAGGAAGLGLDYMMMPIQVSVFWRDEGGDQSLTLVTMITADPPLSAERQ